MECSCGGAKPHHTLGITGCFREVVRGKKPRKLMGRDDYWLVDGIAITGTTLREQRMYHRHECGGWSRPKGGGSWNSLPDET